VQGVLSHWRRPGRLLGGGRSRRCRNRRLLLLLPRGRTRSCPLSDRGDGSWSTPDGLLTARLAGQDGTGAWRFGNAVNAVCLGQRRGMQGRAPAPQRVTDVRMCTLGVPGSMSPLPPEQDATNGLRTRMRTAGEPRQAAAGRHMAGFLPFFAGSISLSLSFSLPWPAPPPGTKQQTPPPPPPPVDGSSPPPALPCPPPGRPWAPGNPSPGPVNHPARDQESGPSLPCPVQGRRACHA
jgi:hypothetical protein